jgi:hypothetical protein
LNLTQFGGKHSTLSGEFGRVVETGGTFRADVRPKGRSALLIFPITADRAEKEGLDDPFLDPLDTAVDP